MLTTGQTHEKPHLADRRRGGVAIRDLFSGVLACAYPDGFEPAKAGNICLIEWITFGIEPLPIAFAAGDQLSMIRHSVRIHPASPMARLRDFVNAIHVILIGDSAIWGWTASALAILTGGGGFRFGAGGAHEGGGGADVVFHNDARINPPLGFARTISRGGKISSLNAKCGAIEPKR